MSQQMFGKYLKKIVICLESFQKEFTWDAEKRSCVSYFGPSLYHFLNTREDTDINNCLEKSKLRKTKWWGKLKNMWMSCEN